MLKPLYTGLGITSLRGIVHLYDSYNRPFFSTLHSLIYLQLSKFTNIFTLNHPMQMEHAMLDSLTSIATWLEVEIPKTYLPSHIFMFIFHPQ